MYLFLTELLIFWIFSWLDKWDWIFFISDVQGIPFRTPPCKVRLFPKKAPFFSFRVHLNKLYLLLPKCWWRQNDDSYVCRLSKSNVWRLPNRTIILCTNINKYCTIFYLQQKASLDIEFNFIKSNQIVLESWAVLIRSHHWKIAWF